MKNKILDQNKLTDILTKLKNEHKKIIFTNGSFDILHAGHVTYLEDAKKMGDILIVGMNSDQSIKKYKSKDRPINPLEDRMTVLSALSCVDYVVPFEETTPINLIKIIQPDIHVKGGDYTEQKLPEAKAVKEHGGIIKFIPFVNGRSTTQVIKKIINTYVGAAMEKCATRPLYKT